MSLVTTFLTPIYLGIIPTACSKLPSAKFSFFKHKIQHKKVSISTKESLIFQFNFHLFPVSYLLLYLMAVHALFYTLMMDLGIDPQRSV